VSSERSSYSTRVRLHRSGQFRVVAVSDGALVSGAGRAVSIRVPR
jgi:hypothetical protein